MQRFKCSPFSSLSGLMRELLGDISSKESFNCLHVNLSRFVSYWVHRRETRGIFQLSNDDLDQTISFSTLMKIGRITFTIDSSCSFGQSQYKEIMPSLPVVLR
jgi:hypothetical protein